MNKYKYTTKKGKTFRVHRLIMEQEIGRKLDFNEVIHHKNGNKNDNRLKNLELISRSNHTKIHIKRAKRKSLICPICKKQFELREKYINYMIHRGRKNFYCSKRCFGKDILTKQWRIKNPRSSKYIELIEQGIKQNLSGYEIGRKFNINNKTVYNYLNRTNRNKLKRNQFNILIQQIEKYYKKGLSGNKIAEKLNISPKTVRKYGRLNKKYKIWIKNKAP